MRPRIIFLLAGRSLGRPKRWDTRSPATLYAVSGDVLDKHQGVGRVKAVP